MTALSLFPSFVSSSSRSHRLCFTEKRYRKSGEAIKKLHPEVNLLAQTILYILIAAKKGHLFFSFELTQLSRQLFIDCYESSQPM